MISLQFHPYGFVVGIALVVAVQLIEFGIRKLEIFPEKFIQKKLYTWLLIAMFFGIVGARLWHVITDFYLYENSLVDVFKIWNGGLSILGAVIGAVGGLFIFLRLFESQKDIQNFFTMLDVVVFGLPVGQAIGRIANYINVELYGLPYDGVFKLFVPIDRRLPGFEHFEFYHPLFAYEMIFTALFSMIFYFFVIYRTAKIKALVGSTMIFQIYVLYYSVVRFFLDFLRIEKGELYFGLLGFNQIFLLMAIVVLMVNLLRSYKKVH